MIERRRTPLGELESGPPSLQRPPVFCCLWTTGPDTGTDGVFRLIALRRGEDGDERFECTCAPFAAGDAFPATARMAREYGITGADLETSPPLADAWEEFRAFVGDGPVVAPDAESFEAWFGTMEERAGRADESPCVPCTGLTELTGLLLPGRLALLKEDLVHALTAQPTGRRRGVLPEELLAALREVAQRFLGLDPRTLRVAAAGYGRALERLRVSDPFAAERLALALALVEQPETWPRAGAGLFDRREGPAEPPFTRAWPANEQAEDLLAELEPYSAIHFAPRERLAPLAAAADDPIAFSEDDLRLLDDVFRVHLPALLARERPEVSDVADFYRESQHRVAVEVARTLGAEELLLVHAPTGTGKTLAYLLPALLWSRRNGVRVAVATYTRALQEQAMEREVPRALDALTRAGVPAGFLVSVLKGRENYLCWKALKLQAPGEEDDAETWLAWTALALFALSDADGDLDRFPLRAPLPLADPHQHRTRVLALLRQVRSRTGCCTTQAERRTCAAEIARRRAERSHLVITNHSFALARQELFRHLVFDECEHLHEQAHNAWSTTVRFEDVRKVLSGLHRPRDGGRRRASSAPLDRLAAKLVPGTPPHATWTECHAGLERARAALEGLERTVRDFDLWRAARGTGPNAREEYALLCRYAEDAEGHALIAARIELTEALNELEAALARLAERLLELKAKGTARLRRGFELARGELIEILAAVESWLPLQDGRPRFRPETFYDVEVDARADFVLAARVLLPNEYLGRNYYGGLANAVFLSATTWIQGGFEAAEGYLGLDRAAHPDPEEERAGCSLRRFRAPEVFDYGRVLVAVPRDAPSIARDKETFLSYTSRFLAWLGERTRGRMLVLFTNASDVERVGGELEEFFRARRIPFWYQGMPGARKEELAGLFRARTDSILLGVDTFWYGADFPGETLEYLILTRLPYGVPDRYHHAQCAALGEAEQRRRIYQPRALAKFRQGFGRLMRAKSDRGAVFLLDGRVLDPRHRMFLRELPLSIGATGENGARFVRGDTDRCVHEALSHMGMLSDVRRRGLGASFLADAAETEARDDGFRVAGRSDGPGDPQDSIEPTLPTLPQPTRLDVPPEDLPY